MNGREKWLIPVVVTAIVAFGAVVAALVVLAISKGEQGQSAASHAQRTAQRSQLVTRETHRALVHSCRAVGDPLRRAVLGQLLDQQRQTKKFTHAQLIAAYQQLFPTKTPQELGHLIHHAKQLRNRYIRQLQNVPPCSQRY